MMNTATMFTSNDEQITQDFISTNTPTEPPNEAFRFDYKGYFGCESHCTLEIHGNLVIAPKRTITKGLQ